MVVAYLGSLVLFFITSFWTVDSFSGNLVTTPSLDNYQRDPDDAEVYRTIAVRTVGHGRAGHADHDLLAFPIAFYMARMASPRTRGLLVVSILLPLWSGYLVKVYAWRLILSRTACSTACSSRSGSAGPGFGEVAVWLVETYLWLPYMIIPIFAGLERVPGSLLEASADLGGAGWHHVPAGDRAARRCRRSSPARSSRSA